MRTTHHRRCPNPHAHTDTSLSACIVHLPTGDVLSRGHNQRVQKGSMILHGETDALENLGRIPNVGILAECAMFSTLSPCQMCTGTVILYKFAKVGGTS